MDRRRSGLCFSFFCCHSFVHTHNHFLSNCIMKRKQGQSDSSKDHVSFDRGQDVKICQVQIRLVVGDKVH